MQRNKQGFIPMVRPLKATLLAAAMSAGAFTTNAHAVAINVTRMEFYPPTQTSPSHVNATVTGSIDFTAGTGGFNSGGTNFFFNPWTATVVQTWEAPGSYTFAGVVPPGGTSPAPGTTYSYSFTLGANQYAAGLFFNWSTNTNIPVLAVFECVGNTTQLLPVNTDGDVSPGTAMQTAPFPSQTAAFTGELQAGLCPGAPVVVPSVTNDGGATLSAGSVNPTGNGSATLSQVISAGIPMDNTLEQQCVGGCFDFVITGLKA